jgi:cation diffusion facilitator family transporter
MNKKVKIARLSIFSNTFLIIIKLIVGLITGSVSIISEAIHSSMDLLAAIIAFFSVKISDTPADAEHPYGHGKYENVSGVIEAILIVIAAIWIIIEALKKVFINQHVESLGIGFIVMFISAGVNLFVSRKLYKVARATESVALEADALHLKTDVYTSAGVGIGLLLIWITGLNFLDPVVAILVAVFILFEAFQLLRNAYFPLVDTAMPEGEVKIIYDTFQEKSLCFHDLKTRKAGHYRFADVHLEMSQSLSLKEVHDVCDEIETELKLKIKHLQINIHVEPAEKSN